MADPSGPSAYAAPFGHLTAQQKVFTMLGSLLGLLLGALDQTVVATAGPAIQRDLHIEPSLYVWITTSYLVASTVLVPIYGKLSDQVGRRKVLLAGIGIFLGGSLLCGLSRSAIQLIVFRAIQGAGSAALFTMAFAVVADIFTPVERGKYQGMFGAVFALSSVVGPLIGGFLTDALSWHWVFFINLPIGAVALTMILTRMPSLRLPDRHAELDIAGALTLSAGVVPLLVAMSLGRAARSAHAGPPHLWLAIALLAVSAVFLAAFVAVELRAKEPVLDFRLFQAKPFRLGILANFLSGATFLAAIVFLPLFMVTVVGLSATRAGLTTMPLTMAIVVTNILVGQVVSRVARYKAILVASMAVCAGGFALMGFTLTPHATQLGMTAMMIVMGIGLGPAMPLFTLALQSSVPIQRIGVATSTSTFSRQMGGTVGLALVGALFGMALAGRADVAALMHEGPQVRQEAPAPSSTPGDVSNRIRVPDHAGAAPSRAEPSPEEPQLASAKEAFTGAIRRVYQVCIVLALLALLVTALMPEVPLRGKERPRPAEP